jgi:hypothetical protein
MAAPAQAVVLWQFWQVVGNPLAAWFDAGVRRADA